MATQPTGTDTTLAPGTTLRQQIMWEVDFDRLTSGTHEVVATLYYAPHNPDDEQEHAELLAYGIPSELVDYQWETERDYCIYQARADGSFISNQDHHTRIFTSRDAAVAACIEALQQRITKAQDAIARLSGKAVQ